MNVKFEAAVLQSMILRATSTADRSQGVEHSAIFSYETISEAARGVRSLAPFCNDSQLRKRKFANSWVFRFLDRAGLSRRRVTAFDKAEDVSTTKQGLAAIQDALRAASVSAAQIYNADETALLLYNSPRYLFVPKEKKRAYSVDEDSKVRYTAMLAVNAEGVLGPPHIIVKCSTNKADQSKSTILKKLFQQTHSKAFNRKNGWELAVWSDTVMVKNKNYKQKAPRKKAGSHGGTSSAPVTVVSSGDASVPPPAVRGPTTTGVPDTAAQTPQVPSKPSTQSSTRRASQRAKTPSSKAMQSRDSTAIQAAIDESDRAVGLPLQADPSGAASAAPQAASAPRQADVPEFVPMVFTRPYLRHATTGTLITAQLHSWMDSAGIVMWIDLLFAKLDPKPAVLVWDNASVHKSSPSIAAALQRHGIKSLFLPPNCTDELQPLDLSVCTRAVTRAYLPHCLAGQWNDQGWHAQVQKPNDFGKCEAVQPVTCCLVSTRCRCKGWHPSPRVESTEAVVDLNHSRLAGLFGGIERGSCSQGWNCSHICLSRTAT